MKTQLLNWVFVENDSSDEWKTFFQKKVQIKSVIADSSVLFHHSSPNGIGYPTLVSLM